MHVFKSILQSINNQLCIVGITDVITLLPTITALDDFIKKDIHSPEAFQVSSLPKKGASKRINFFVHQRLSTATTTDLFQRES